MSNSKKKEERISRYMWRGGRYAGTSACTIVAGYFMESQPARKNDLLLLSIPILASVYFFIRYANRFPRTEATNGPRDAIGSFAQAEAVRLYFFLILIPYTAFVIFYVSRSEPVSYQLLLSLALYVGLFIYYGRFLARYESNGKSPLIRHWLVWPVILSIAIGLFYGLSFSSLKVSFLPLLPVILIVLLFIASLNLSRKLYLWLTLFVVLAVTTVSVLNQAGYLYVPPLIGLSSMLFCVAASAYLAVFEAGSITSDLAHETGNELRAQRYAQATLAALTVSVWLLPFYYIFSNYGSAFLIGFAIHAFASFLVWFYLGKEPYLQKWQWSDIKVLPGVLFLGLLVLSPTRLFNEQLSFRFLKGFSAWGFGLLVAIVLVLMGQLVKDFVALRDKDEVEAPVYELFKDRINFTRILSLLCFLLSCGIAFRLQYIDETSPQYPRAELAFLVYVISVLLCFVIEVREFFRPRRKLSPTGTAVAGILLIIRAFTSFLIMLVVFVPFYWEGYGVIASLLSSLPFLFAAAGGFAVNDYYDAEKDLINKPYRAIPSRKIRRPFALRLGLVLIGVAGFLSFAVYRTKFQLFLYLASIAGVGAYNSVVKHLSLSKTVLTAGISVLPVFYVTVSLSYPLAYFFIPVGGFLFLLGRELLMDIRDVEGDELAGMQTLPTLIGPNATAAIAFFLFGLCGAFLAIFALATGSVRHTIFTSIVSLSVIPLPLLWFYNAGAYRRAAIISLYLPITCGICLLVK